MKQTHAYVLDLTKIDGNGDFSCPRCGTAISPDDYTEEAYSILETKVNSHGLEELVIRCNKCASKLHLTGFSLLQKLSETDEEKRKKKKREEPLCYIVHV
jgi:DNA-directed RNA polymerase subunit RPC12/RpoP